MRKIYVAAAFQAAIFSKNSAAQAEACGYTFNGSTVH